MAEPSVSEVSETITLHQLCLLPEAWDEVKGFIAKRWPEFDVLRAPGLETAEEHEAGIATYIMALR